MRDHTREKTSGEGTAREAENIDSVTGLVVTHEEFVACNHVGVKARRQSRIQYCLEFAQQGTEPAHMDRPFCRIGTDASCSILSVNRLGVPYQSLRW